MLCQLVFKNRTPLAFKATRSTRDASSLEYIPGTSLLGALAHAHIQMNNEKAHFNELFSQSGLKLGNMYPAGFKMLEDSFKDKPFYSKTFPATAVSCKRFQGFKEQGRYETDEMHGVFDLLKNWTLFALNERKNNCGLNAALKCAYKDDDFICEEDMAPINGYYGLDHNMVAEKVTPRTELSTLTGIDRHTGTARRGILYSYENIPEGQLFTGQVAIEPNKWESFKEYLKEAAESGYLRVGNNRSRGFGEIVLISADQKGEDTADDIRKRVEDFTSCVNEVAQENDVAQPYSHLIPVTLISDSLIMDRLQRYHSGLDEEFWVREISKSPADLVCVASSCREMIGWNALYGVPREKVMLINKGSVFVFGLSIDPSTSFWEDLQEAQVKGIGERKNEGFGQISVADIFHLEVFEK